MLTGERAAGEGRAHTGWELVATKMRISRLPRSRSPLAVKFSAPGQQLLRAVREGLAGSQGTHGGRSSSFERAKARVNRVDAAPALALAPAPQLLPRVCLCGAGCAGLWRPSGGVAQGRSQLGSVCKRTPQCLSTRLPPSLHAPRRARRHAQQPRFCCTPPCVAREGPHSPPIRHTHPRPPLQRWSPPTTAPPPAAPRPPPPRPPWPAAAAAPTSPARRRRPRPPRQSPAARQRPAAVTARAPTTP